jgi:chromosome segregation protein
LFVKRLEMHGFKSFADKTTFELTPGITVVVGPNGCGKSNITDAVRWVLGEQSARHLRGTRMDDIIFGGTASRKPLSFAEVSITLDHTDGALGLDYQEVTVTRRLYRSGESEYLLNKRQCRLKDIVELFMDTGIGKEAYSFIGQGRVDELLNARPEERRQIFEEAAGILKYKNRKREAKRRLAETAENLLRVGDIIHELSGQLEPLSEQASAARHYLELRDSLRTLDVDMLVHDARQFRERWYEMDKKTRAAADELLQQQATVGKRETELAQAQMTLDEEQSAVAAMQRDAQRLTSELEKIQSHTAVIQEKIRGVDRQLTEGKALLDDLKRQDGELDQENTRITEQMSAASTGLLKAENDLKAAQQILDQMESSPEALRSVACQEELDKLSTAIRHLESDYSRLDVELEQMAEKAQTLESERLQKASEYHELQEKGKALLAEKDKLVQQKQQLMEQSAVNKAQRTDTTAQLDKLSALRVKSEKEQADAENKQRLLTELEDAMAGYYQGVKSVLSAKKQHGQFAGILGTVVDLLDVPSQYVAAVEAALGTSLQNLVAADDNVAKEAIAYLKKTRGGRATFLPLNILDVQPRRQVPQELQAQPGYIGVAADLIRTEQRFTPVAESLLARVHVVRDLDAAVSVARILRFRERVVTLDGDVMLPGGAMTGGHDKKQGGILSRRREAEALKETIRTMALESKELQRQSDLLMHDLHETATALTVLEEKIREVELAISVRENEVAFLARQADTVLRSQDAYVTEIEALVIRRKEKEDALTLARERLEGYQEQEKELRVELARLAGTLSAREQEKRSLREQYTECRVRLASLHKQQEHYEDERERLLRERAIVAEKKKSKEVEMRELRSQRLELDGQVEEDQEKAAELEEARRGILSDLVEREAALKEKSTLFREEAEQLRQFEKSLTGLERKQARLEVERGRVEVELQAVLDRLRESWELDFEEAERVARPLEDRAAAREKVRLLKENIQELGTVNLGAIDEYNRVSERVEFLTVQRDDLREGEKDLLRIIREIDSRMGEKFASSFAVINEQFGLVFKELFGGGRAHLRLTDPENPLEAGIEIVAQPPGKKLQQLSLLSGGEKALTAIALLFAFLNVKPTPFCVLDEIEAALDEANLIRFTQYLRNLCGQTQFILISHRKKTMEQADILYGVTMEELGVSKQISVRLRGGQAETPGATA